MNPKTNDNSIKSDPFSHLHLHTSYSLLDGAIRIPDLIKHVKSQGMNSVAMTDHGNMFGAIEFYKEANKEWIKPIIGCEFYVSPGDRKEKKNLTGLADGNNYHLILLAKDKKGYSNLIRLASRSYSEGFYRKPRIDYELLSNHSDGLVCLTACLGGEVQQKILRNRFDEASNLAAKLKEIFTKDRFYLEIQNHGIADEVVAAKGNIEIAKKHDIELCLTNDSHFLKKTDQAAQDILLRINQKKTIEDPLAFAFNSEFYVKSPHEMAQLFPELPQAYHNTQYIADMVDLDFSLGNPLLPRFDIPKEESLDSYLKKLAMSGLKKRYKEISPKIQKRFDYEYSIITKMDFSGYFLIVQDFINFAKKRNIPTGPGRGSAAGSIISYALGITDIDPLRYGLLFERFLNPDRKEMPDIDVDFCTERRDEVIQYVRHKYGVDKVGQIITYGTMSARACLKDVARVLNIPYGEANQISQMFPDVLNISIKDALTASKELREYSESSETKKKLFQVALSLEGNVRHTGVHAAGIVIAPDPLEKILPMATIKYNGNAKERVLVSQYDMQALADVGLVKMDLLGLRNLSVINETIESIAKRLGEKVKFDTNKMDDPKSYKLIQSAMLAGIFQLETSPGMRELVIRTKPAIFEDIIALIALFRPGPLQSGMTDSYVNRKNGVEKVSFAHPDLEQILGETYGVILYQEQVMQIFQKIGGFTASQADSLRKAMGKKIPEKMEELHKKFIEGAKKNQYNSKFSRDLYEQMLQFASYGFNKSHSAAYACIVYQTAYLKANYLTDYMCAILNSNIDKTEKLVQYISECRSLGIQILGPDINKSQIHFSVEKDNIIRFGLAGVKNVGALAIEEMLKVRQKQKNAMFYSFFNFMENIDLKKCNRRMLEALNQGGAFLSLGYKRKSLHEGIELGLNYAQKIQKDKMNGQNSLFGDHKSSNGYEETIPHGESALEYSKMEILSMERDILGFYLSGHPLERYNTKLRNAKIPTIANLENLPRNKEVKLAVIIYDFSIRLTKAGSEMCRLSLEDMSGTCEAVAFPKSFTKIRNLLEKGTLVFINAVLEKKEETGTNSLIINQMKRMDSELLSEYQEKSLHIKLIQKNKEIKIVDQLKTILSTNQGPLNVYFHLLDKQSGKVSQVIRAHDTFRVDYSNELCQRLSRIQGVSAVDLSIGDTILNKYRLASSNIIAN